MPKDSVVVPVVNAEKYIKHCKSCNICQIFDNIELIFTDSFSDELNLEFCNALADLKKELQKRSLFDKFEKDFVNLALNISIYVLNSVDNRESFVKLAELLKSKYFFEFNIAGHSCAYFLNDSDFDALLDIIEMSPNELWQSRSEASANTDYPLFDIDSWQNDTPIISDGSIRISVIIPVYNAEEFVGECVDSIRNNTLKDIEIICVNDGSTDNSLAVLNSLKEQDDRIIVVDKPNGGPSETRNAGIELARGEYISFIDSDDYIHPKTYEYLYSQAVKNNLDQLYFSAKSFYDGEDIYAEFSEFDELYRRRADYSEIATGRQMFIKMSNNAEFRPSPCMLISKREFLNKHNIRFAKGLLHEDNLFIIQCMTYAKRVGYANANLYFRRMRRNSIMTGSNYIKRVYSYYKIIKILEQFAKKENLKSDKPFFEALKYRLSVMNYNACGIAEKIKADELEAFSDTLDEDEAIDFYNYINAIVVLLAEKKENAKRYKELKESEIIVEYKLKQANENLKKDVSALEKQNKSLLSKKLVRIALKLDRFFAKLKRRFK